MLSRLDLLNNTSLLGILAQNNPKLGCIILNDLSVVTALWSKDSQAVYTTDPNDSACILAAVPTLSEWATLIVFLLLLILGVAAINTRIIYSTAGSKTVL